MSKDKEGKAPSSQVPHASPKHEMIQLQKHGSQVGFCISGTGT